MHNVVSTQRRQYRVLTSGGGSSSALTVERAQKLVNLGFEWSAKDPRMVPWETRFRQLQDFAVSIATFGMLSLVPILVHFVLKFRALF